MVGITTTCRQLIESDKRDYAIRVNMTLANNTTLVIENDDIWEGGLTIDQATSNGDSFDIGCAIIGKCKLVLNNIYEKFTNYDFYNATFYLFLGIVGDNLGTGSQRYYQMGRYTVDSTSYNGSMITLDCLDNLWKLDVPFNKITTITYPALASTIVARICSYCGMGIRNFPGNFTIDEIKDTDLNCREVMQYIAQMGGYYIFANTSGQAEFGWYNKEPYYHSLPSCSSSSVSTEEYIITGVRVTYSDDDGQSDVYYADKELEKTYPRYLLAIEDNKLITSNIVASDVASRVGAKVAGTRIRAFNVSALGDFTLQAGDPCEITDHRGNKYQSYITNLTFTTGSYETFSCGAISPNQGLTTRYSDAVRTLIEAKKISQESISDYDRAVQNMNNLANEALGYNKYEYESSTGTITWLYSGTLIDTRKPNKPVFRDSENVFKISGEGVFISKDGGTTYTNGYDANSGTAILNLIYARGINCDWIKAGTLTLGGGNNVNGLAEVYDGENNLVTRLDETGLKVEKGSTSGCDIDVVNNGKIEFYSDDNKQYRVGKIDKNGFRLKQNYDSGTYMEVDGTHLEFGQVVSSSGFDPEFYIGYDFVSDYASLSTSKRLGILCDGLAINGQRGMNTSIDVVTRIYGDGSVERGKLTFTDGILTAFDWI